MSTNTVDLSVNLGKLRLKNPVMPASGTFGYGKEFADFLNLEDLGAIIVKGTTLRPKLGNPQHRFIEVAGCCYLSTVGLQNVGVENFVKDKLPYLRKFSTPVIVNIAGENIDEFIEIIKILNEADGIQAIQINMVCPNANAGGKIFSSNPQIAFNLIQAVRNATHLMIIAKISSGLNSIEEIAKACEQAGANAIRPGSGEVGMAIDIMTRRSKLGQNMVGSLGGPSRKPVNIRAVWLVSKAVKIPVVGGGGITNAEDAIEFLIAGATAIEIGTQNLINPRVTIEIINGIENYLIDNGIPSVNAIIGSMELPEN